MSVPPKLGYNRFKVPGNFIMPADRFIQIYCNATCGRYPQHVVTRKPNCSTASTSDCAAPFPVHMHQSSNKTNAHSVSTSAI